MQMSGEEHSGQGDQQLKGSVAGVYLTWEQNSKEVSEAAKEVMRMVEMKLENYSVEGVHARRPYKALVYSKNFNIFP